MIKNDEIFALSSDARIVRAILEDLEEEGRIYKVNPSYYIATEAWDRAVDAARSFDDKFILADYRDRLGTSRKYAAELLPAMDKAGITIFDGETRKAVK
jgi:selenocysteine-specific elongation factor